MPIPFVDLKSQYARIKQEVDAAIHGVLDHGQYILGKEHQAFEEQLADFTGAKHAIGVSSGTDALVIGLMSQNIGPGDAVFVPSFTYVATAEAILLLGASPVFVEVNPDSFTMDPAHLQFMIDQIKAEGKLRPAVVIPVDLFGQPAEYPGICPIAEREGMFVIADAAQGIGGALGNKRIGSLAPLTTASFFPAKPLGAYGDGGAVLTDNEDLAKLCKSLRFHGTGKHAYDVVRVGLNGRLDTIQAAILSVKLSVFEDEIQAREALSLKYDSGLKGLVTLPYRVPNSQSAWAQYTIKTDRRDELQAFLKEKGIPSMVYYALPMHVQPAYVEFGDGPGSMEISEGLGSEVLSLPMHAYMDEETSDFIVSSIKEFFGKAA